MKYFDGQVFNLPIEIALERKFLVPYFYKPIYVYAAKEEEGRFRKQSRIIVSYFRNGKCIDPESLTKILRNRLRIISITQAKIELRRFYKYAKLSLDFEEIRDELEDLLIQYDLTMEDIDVYDYEEIEDEIDE